MGSGLRDFLLSTLFMPPSWSWYLLIKMLNNMNFNRLIIGSYNRSGKVSLLSFGLYDLYPTFKVFLK